MQALLELFALELVRICGHDLVTLALMKATGLSELPSFLIRGLLLIRVIHLLFRHSGTDVAVSNVPVVVTITFGD